MFTLPSINDSQADFFLPEEGSYLLRCVGIGEEQPDSFTPGKFRRRFEFEVLDDGNCPEDHVGKKFGVYYGMSSHPKSNLYGVAKALSGGYIDPDQTWSETMFDNKQMQATVTHKAPNSEGKIWPRLEGPVPVRTSRRGAGAPAQVVDTETGEITDEVPF